MTELLASAMAAAGELPDEMQDEVARMVLMLAGHEQGLAELREDDERAVRLSQAAAARGDFATDEAVAAVWAKYGL